MRLWLELTANSHGYHVSMVDMTHPPSPGVDKHPSLALVASAGELPGSRLFDDLGTPDATAKWLIGQGLAGADSVLYDTCQGRLASLRTAVREVFVARIQQTSPSSNSLQALNDALTNAPGALRLRYDPVAGFARSTEHPATQVVEYAMAVIAEDAAKLLTGQDAASLAECEADSCDRIFIRTHARRQWCSNRCGDRMRAARAQSRKREQRVEAVL